MLNRAKSLPSNILKDLKPANLLKSNTFQMNRDLESKILKGKENLTLETISKLETVQVINIVEVPGLHKEFEEIPGG